MKNADCEAVRLAEMARKDGEAPDLGERETAAHLETCPRCREEIERLSALSRDLENHRILPADADLWGGIHRGLARTRASDRVRRLLPVAAALLPVYRIAEAVGPAGLFSVGRLVPVALLLAILLILGDNPFALNPALEPEGEMP